VCDGHGGQHTVADPNDVPDDFKECTVDSCQGDTPHHENKPQGTFCSFALKCDGNGNCAGCTSTDQCVGFDNDCHTHTCNNSQCTYTFSDKGTETSLQINGDCQKAVCDGAGNSVTQPDDTDVPDDSNECTKDSCNNGVKSEDDLPRGTACSKGVCDGTTVCNECNVPADCPTPPICVTATCEKNKCGTANVANGVPAPASEQTPGDCKTVICDGNGATQTAATNDIPDDKKECTIDTCDGTNPTFTPIVAGAPCPVTAGKVCDGKGACVAAH
jgi:hypothetical protein